MLSTYKFLRRRTRYVYVGTIVILFLYVYYSDYYSKILLRLDNFLHTKTFSPIYPTTVRPNNLKTSFRLMNTFDKVSNHGIPFDIKWNVYLEEFDLLNVKNINSTAVLSSTPIIGTAVSTNHFYEFGFLIRSLAAVHNNTKMLYIYDLGMSEQERSHLLTNHGKQIFEIRKFNFSKYPKNFVHLRDFRWKPMIVAELLKEFPSMWWMDSSAKILKPIDHFYKEIRNCVRNESDCQFYPWTLISPAGHSIYAATWPKMYEFMPIPLNVTKYLHMWAATIQLIFATKTVRENILRYWVLCALEEECMVPSGSTINCKFGDGRNNYTDYAECHRHDQSAVNILLARVNNFVERKYRRETENVFDIKKF